MRLCSFFCSSVSFHDSFLTLFFPASSALIAGPCHAGNGLFLCRWNDPDSHTSTYLLGGWVWSSGEGLIVGPAVKFNLFKIALLLGRRAGFLVSCVMWSNVLHLLSSTLSPLTHYNENSLGFCYLKMSCLIRVVCLGNFYRGSPMKLSILDLQKWQFHVVPT